MKTFLAVVGAICLAMTSLIVIGLLFVRWKFGKFAASLEDSGMDLEQMIPPFRITLEPDNAHEWMNGDDVRRFGDELDAAGFLRIGTFRTIPTTLPLEAWHHPSELVYVTISEQELLGCWCDLTSVLDDSSAVSVSSGADYLVAGPPSLDMEFLTGAAFLDVLQRLLDKRGDRTAAVTSAAAFPEFFVEQWRSFMDFQIERGGPTESEIRRVMQRGSSGTSTVDDEQIERLRLIWRQRISVVLHERLREAWLVQSGVSALEWERLQDRTVFIHDSVSPEELVSMSTMGFDWNEVDARYADFEEELLGVAEASSAREAFAAMNLRLHEDSRFKKIGELESPVPTDVYHGPEEFD